jgi:hypothetical protein
VSNVLEIQRPLTMTSDPLGFLRTPINDDPTGLNELDRVRVRNTSNARLFITNVGTTVGAFGTTIDGDEGTVRDADAHVLSVPAGTRALRVVVRRQLLATNTIATIEGASGTLALVVAPGQVELLPVEGGLQGITSSGAQGVNAIVEVGDGADCGEGCTPLSWPTGFVPTGVVLSDTSTPDSIGVSLQQLDFFDR